MLPTKGYFQDIECPYLNSSCGRPYCHFRHRKKQVELLEEIVTQAEKETPVIPTYKPTPKSELANIHSSKSHIPISYVPDLAFRQERKARPLPKFEKPTYKPTPLSLLSSANKSRISVSDENGEHIDVIKEIKQNIANVEYDPTKSLQPATDIDFEGLSTEFDMIDDIINTSGDKPKTVSDDDAYDPSKTVVKVSSVDNDETELPSKTELEEDAPSASHLINNPVKEKTAGKSSRDKEKATKKTNNESRPKSSEDQQKTNSSTKEDKNQKEESEEIVQKTSEKLQKVGSKDIKEKRGSTSNKSEKERTNSSKPKIKEKSPSRSKEKEKSKEKKKKKQENEEKETIKRSKGDGGSKEKTMKKTNDNSNSKSGERKKGSEEKAEKSKTESKIISEEKMKSKESTNESKQKFKGEEISKEKQKSKEISKEKQKIKEMSSEKQKSKEISEEKHKSKEKTDKHVSKSSDTKNKHVEKKERNQSDKEKRSSKDHKTSITKEKHKNREKEHRKSKSNSQSSEKYKKEENRRKNKDKMKKSISSISLEEQSENEMSDNDHHIDNEFMNSDDMSKMEVDTDLEEDEDETMMECYRIFNEYKAPQQNRKERSPEKSEDVVSSSSDIYIPENIGKKRIAHPNSLKYPMYHEIVPENKPKIVSTPGQSLANRYKLAKLAQANREQELLMNEMHSEMQQNMMTKRPAPSLLEAARERKIRREMEKEQKSIQSTSLVDDILHGISKNPQLKVVKKIAPAQNVMLMAKSKERISKIKPAASLKTIAHTQKSGRVAHVPDVSLTDIPDVIDADKSKLPVNVRTRFLTLIADECVKLYISKAEAFSRALSEEYSCYAKCKVLVTYRNSAMLAMNRLRKEVLERDKSGLGLIGIGEDTDRNSSSEYKGWKFYDRIKKWVLTDEELDIHGYPRESEEHHGRAVIRNFKRQISLNLDYNQRMCCRCHKLYQVDDDGWPLIEEECCYHPLKKRTIRGEQTYLCCRSNDESGCATSDWHVSETAVTGELDGFQTTMNSDNDSDPRNYAIYALDCEMCYTTKGLELTRVTVVDTECKTVYESLVKPFNPIIDYNTRFSGITKEQMDKTSTSILQVQANILHLCNSKTILVGHSLESDMKALKIVHENVIDTSVLFPHKMGLPHKRALKALASEYLRKIIQNDVSGHDSAEDALTCMELLKWKVKDELKVKGS